jgi:hypothetical protein
LFFIFRVFGHNYIPYFAFLPLPWQLVLGDFFTDYIGLVLSSEFLASDDAYPDGAHVAFVDHST